MDIKTQQRSVSLGIAEEEKYYLLDEYLDSERTTEQHAVEIRKLIDKWDIDYIYIDSAAQQTRYDFAQNYDISTLNAKKSVLDGIGHVGGIVDNDRLIVDAKCVESLMALDQYQWDPNPNLLKEKTKTQFCLSHGGRTQVWSLFI